MKVSTGILIAVKIGQMPLKHGGLMNYNKPLITWWQTQQVCKNLQDITAI